MPGVEATTVNVALGSTCLYNALRGLRGLQPDPSADPNLLDFVGASDVGDGPRFAAFASAQWGLLYGNHRLLYTPRTQLVALYDVQRDPHELKNLVDENPQLAPQLLGHLFGLHNEPLR